MEHVTPWWRDGEREVVQGKMVENFASYLLK